MPRTAWEVLGRKKCEKCRSGLANLQFLGTPRKPADWNRSPAPPAPISSSAVAPARDRGEKLPIGHGGGAQGASAGSRKKPALPGVDQMAVASTNRAAAYSSQS